MSNVLEQQLDCRFLDRPDDLEANEVLVAVLGDAGREELVKMPLKDVR